MTESYHIKQCFSFFFCADLYLNIISKNKIVGGTSIADRQNIFGDKIVTENYVID